MTGKTGKKCLSALPIATACSCAWDGNGGDQRLFPAPKTLDDRPALLWCRRGRLLAD